MKTAPQDYFTELSQLFFVTRQRIRDELPEKLTPDPHHWFRMEIIRYIGGATPTMHEIAQYARVRASSATAVVRRLEREGLIVRRHDPKDRRVVRISLTKRGEKSLAAHIECSRRLMHKVFGQLDRADVETLTHILRSVALS